MGELLESERAGAVAVLTLNRPEKRNALSLELRERMAGELTLLAADDDVSCAVLTGAGPAFCAGMDRSEFGGDRAQKERLVELSLAAFDAVIRFPKPLVCAANGPAVAGGFALALLCDLRLASSEATFGFGEVPLGIPPSYAAARAALPQALAAELCLTGRMLGAEDARVRGVVSEVHAPQDLMPRAMEVAAAIAALPRASTAGAKARIVVERQTVLGPLFQAEEIALREALLGG